MLVGFKFCVVFFSTVGGVIAIFNDTVAVSAVFAIKFDTIAILWAGGHMLRTDPICNHLVGENIHVLWLLIADNDDDIPFDCCFALDLSVFRLSSQPCTPVQSKSEKMERI